MCKYRVSIEMWINAERAGVKENPFMMLIWKAPIRVGGVSSLVMIWTRFYRNSL